jgi:hypothetical protein
MITDSLKQIGLFLDGEKNTETVEKADYEPSDREKDVMKVMKNRMEAGYSTARQSRVEFNDLSVLDKDTACTLAYNGYQAGDGHTGDGIDSWRSNALRLVERNKVISISGHAISRLGLLKQEAASQGSVPQQEASRVMNTLANWLFNTFMSRRDKLMLMTQCLVNPAGIMHLECKHKGEDIEYTFTNVPVDQLYIENFFEPDIQKQGWLVFRQVRGHAYYERKYKGNKNWEYVRKGMHCLSTDANGDFYYVYDSALQKELDEELTSYDLDGKMYVTLNGVVMKDGENQREDGLYPFVKSGYQLLRENCFYYASLVHIAGYDARVINSLYPIVIDGAIWNSRPPMAYFGREKVSSDVMIPGSMTSFSDKDAKVMPLAPPFDLNSGFSAVTKAEESLNQATDMGQLTPEALNYSTAYGLSVAEQRRNESLGPFAELIIDLSAQLTRLIRGDIVQYFTLPDVSNITGDSSLAYRSFLVKHKHGDAERLKFEKMTKDALKESYETLQQEWDTGTKVTRIDPIAFRKLKFMSVLSDDVLAPKSEQVRMAYNLQTFDRLIQAKGAGSNVDLDMAAKVLLLEDNERTAKDPDLYFAKPQPQAQTQPNPLAAPNVPGVPANVAQPIA